MTRIRSRSAAVRSLTPMASLDLVAPVKRMAEAAVTHAENGLGPAPRNPLVTRLLDLVVALAVLGITLPFYPIVMLAIRIDSDGPALFRQVRLGKNGYPFVMYKFRTMRWNASTTPDPLDRHITDMWMRGEAFDAFSQSLVSSPGLQSTPSSEWAAPTVVQRDRYATTSFKLKNDPRITQVGRLLRKISMDELPQFLNVVRGEMSVVGPRPPIVVEFDHYNTRELARLAVKPGITGLWQVEGRGQVSFQEMIEMDLRYVTSNSFRGDIAILLRTVPAVLSGKGAS